MLYTDFSVDLSIELNERANMQIDLRLMRYKDQTHLCQPESNRDPGLTRTG